MMILMMMMMIIIIIIVIGSLVDKAQKYFHDVSARLQVDAFLAGLAGGAPPPPNPVMLDNGVGQLVY